MAIQRELNGNAFTYIVYDDEGFASEIYHLPANSVQTLQGINGDVFLKFYFPNGKDIVLPYSSITYIRLHYN